MRAAHAAAKKNKGGDFATINSSVRYVESMSPPALMDHKLTKKPLRDRHERKFSVTTMKAGRVPRGSIAEKTQAGTKAALQDGATSRFPLPYPGLDVDWPPKNPLLNLRVRQHNPYSGVTLSSGARGARNHSESRKLLDGDSLGAAAVKGSKRPVLASKRLTKVVSGRAVAPPSVSGQTWREHFIPMKRCNKIRSTLENQRRAEWAEPSLVGREETFRGSGDRKVKRPASAPTRREVGVSQNGGVLEVLSRLTDGAHNAPEEFRIMKWVLLRETYITKLQAVVSAGRKRAPSPRNGRAERLVGAAGAPKLFGILTDLLTVLRRITVEIVEGVERWRGGSTDKAFIWGSSNYLLKAASDTSFLAHLPGLEKHLGVSISNNPFLCHVGLAGRSAHMPSNRRSKDARELAVGHKVSKFPFSRSKPLGVSAKRVEAAAAVLYREVLQAQKVIESATRSSSPTWFRNSSEPRQVRVRWKASHKTDSCTNERELSRSFRTARELGGHPRNINEYQDRTVYPEHRVTDRNRPEACPGEARRKRGFSESRPIGNDAPVILCKNGYHRDVDESVSAHILDSTVDEPTTVLRDDNIIAHNCGGYAERYFPCNDYFNEECPSKNGKETWVGCSSTRYKEANNIARVDGKIPQCRCNSDVICQHHLVHERRRYGDTIVESAPALGLNDNQNQGRDERAEQPEPPGEYQASEVYKPLSAPMASESSNAAGSPVVTQITGAPDISGGKGTLDPKENESCTPEDNRRSPFIAVFNMCDGMLTNLQGFAVEGRAKTSTKEGVRGMDAESSFIAMPNDRKEQAHGHAVRESPSPCEPIHSELDEADKDKPSGEPSIPSVSMNIEVRNSKDVCNNAQSFGTDDEEPLWCSATNEYQTQNMHSAPRMGKITQKDTDINVDDRHEEGLRCGTSKDTLVNIFMAWAAKTELRLGFCDAKATKHHRRYMFRGGMDLWKAYHPQVVATRMVEVYAGQFDLSRISVRYAFNALRSHAKCTRVAARSRSVFENLAMRLEYAGKMGLRLAFRRWVRSMGESGSGDKEASSRFDGPLAQGRMNDIWQTRRAKSKLAGSLAIPFTASVASKTGVLAQPMEGRQRSHFVATKMKNNSWEQLAREGGSRIDPSLPQLESEKKFEQEEEGQASGSTTDTGKSRTVVIGPPTSPTGDTARHINRG